MEQTTGKRINTLTDLFTAIHGLEKLGMAYTVDSKEGETYSERHWIVKVQR